MLSFPCAFLGEKCPRKVENGSRVVARLPTDTHRLTHSLGVFNSPANHMSCPPKRSQTNWGCCPRTRGPADPASRGLRAFFPLFAPFTPRTHHIHARHASLRGKKEKKENRGEEKTRKPPFHARAHTRTHIHTYHRSICM